MVRYGEWREATNPGRPLAKLDPLVAAGGGLAAALVGCLVCCLGAIPAFISAYEALRKRQALRGVDRYRDVPALYSQHACYLTLHYGGITYGRDEGLVSLPEGRLVYEGRRTSFSVPALDVANSKIGKLGLGFDFQTPAGLCTALIQPIDRGEMEDDHRGWVRTRASVTEEESIVLPPCRSNIEARTWLRLTKKATYFLAAAELVVIGFAAAAPELENLIGIAIFGLLACAVLAWSVSRWHEILRRLDQAPALPESLS